MLAGQPPFPDTNIISQMIRHATETPKALKELNPAVPDGLQQIVNWMLAKDSAQRYPTPERAAQALQVFLVAGAEPLAAPEADPRMRPFLTWLEVESGKQPVASAAAAHAVPAIKPPSGTLPAVAKPAKLPRPSGNPRAGGAHAHRQATEEKKPLLASRAAAGSAAAPSVLAAEMPVEIDVELVPITPSGAEKSTGGLRLSRRDAILFGIGAILGAVVTFVGALIARFSRRE